jgi:HAD superfamily hydrolase (TIGR01509 family)
MTFDLVIFDCDGVLVDSEMLSARVLKEMLANEGLAITEDIFRSDFLGRSFAAARARIEERFSRALPDAFGELYRKQLLSEMRGKLLAMPGIQKVLASLRVPFCVATGSSPERLAVSLIETGLASYFERRSFTSSLVLNGKPAPDLMLYAAKTMNVAPEKCLVIEDSEMGVRAGHAANMTVWHFTGGSHIKGGYTLPSNILVERSVSTMTELHQMLCDEGLCV